MSHFSPFKNFKADIPASIVVFLVALPLCLGIALASGAPLYSGLIAGIVGGIVVASLSGSPAGVSGPAAGLAVIVLGAIQQLGFEIFLMAVVLAGIIQILMGFAKGGIIAYYFPSSVIMGMLSGIGIIIFIKQIPHAFGYDKSPEGEMGFSQMDGENTFSELVNMLNFISPGALIITGVALAILLLWETKFMKSQRIFQIIPGPLVAVISGIVLNLVFKSIPDLALRTDQSVNVPVADSFSGFLSNFTFPDFVQGLQNTQVYITAVVIAVVASLETLLCVEATDKLDPYKRVTPTNRELKAQGVGNIVSGLIGGLPITQVIVRSSANIQSGAKTKASAIIHGFLILGSIIAIPHLLNMIPLATLAAILFIVGYKLAKPSLFKKIYKQGRGQFIPFVATILGIVFTDLLIGLGIGLVIAIFYILFNNYQITHFETNEEQVENGKKKIKIQLAQELTFLNKATILKALADIPDNSIVEIDASHTRYMHHDIFEIIEDFKTSATERDIEVKTKSLYEPVETKAPSHIKISTDRKKDKSKKEAIH